MSAEEFEFSNILPVLVGAIALFIVIFLLNRTINRIFFQSKYIETLRDFAKSHGYKKPISKWTFIFLEISAVCFGVFFISEFFKNPFLTFGIIFILLIIAVLFAVKFYVPPFKAFAFAENLNYESQNDGQDVVTGKYDHRDIFVKMEKAGISPDGSIRFTEQEGRTNLVKRILSVSVSINDEEIKNIRYENGKIIADPVISTNDFSAPEKMLADIPVSDNVRLYISTINSKTHLTLEKTNTNILFLAELYYIREITRLILDSVAGQRQISN